MKFTGTMIEDLMATVERAERRAQRDGALVVKAPAVERLLVKSLLAEPWFAPRENADYDSKFIGVA